jgi:hypothetical protein
MPVSILLVSLLGDVLSPGYGPVAALGTFAICSIPLACWLIFLLVVRADDRLEARRRD